MMYRHRIAWAITLAPIVAAIVGVRLNGQAQTTTLIRRAQMIDGTGAPSRRDDVRIAGDRIVAVGQLTPTEGEHVVDGNGLALAPGFIDTHSHHDRGLDTARDALPMVSQGVTTIVVGQDGGGSNLAALFARLESQPVSVNVASYAGHGSIRGRVMGDDFKRRATAEEIERMKPLLKAEMDAGALGLSTGLEYDPGIYSAPEEVLALAKVAADAGGRYISHMRSEDRWFWEALDELIAIGRSHRMPVQVSHMKLGMHDLWGQAEKLIGVLDRARADGVQLTADIYPYTYWQSNLGVLYPKRNFSDEKETEFVLAHVSLADDIIFNSFRAHPEYVGKTLADVAKLNGTPPAKMLMALLAESGGSGAGIVAKGMADADVERLLQWPFANVCSDGTSTGLHPRGYGSFSKVLGPYVRDKKLFPLEEAVRKMSSLAAANVGLIDRGRIAPGYFADLVLFDSAVVADRADFGKAQAPAVGVKTVWVNGQIVFQDGKTTAVYSGRPLRRENRARSAAAQDAKAAAPAVAFVRVNSDAAR
jgi:N-acyl-D-amino-acid deacylase